MKKAQNELRNLLFQIAGVKYKELVAIILSWRNAVGDELADRSKIKTFEKRRLIVNVVNSGIKQDFIFMEKDIIKKLTDLTDIKIDSIRFND